MAIFAIMAAAPHNGLGERIQSLYPDNHAWGDRTWMVTSEEAPQAIARKMGVGERQEDGTTVSEFGHIVILKLAASYWGYGPTSFWDWMKSAFQRDPQ